LGTSSPTTRTRKRSSKTLHCAFHNKAKNFFEFGVWTEHFCAKGGRMYPRPFGPRVWVWAAICENGKKAPVMVCSGDRSIFQNIHERDCGACARGNLCESLDASGEHWWFHFRWCARNSRSRGAGSPNGCRVLDHDCSRNIRARKRRSRTMSRKTRRPSSRPFSIREALTAEEIKALPPEWGPRTSLAAAQSQI
jgi:hypothetical protein